MGLNEKQKTVDNEALGVEDEEACSCRRTDEASSSGRYHRIDIPGSRNSGKSLEQLESEEDVSRSHMFQRVRNLVWIKQNELYYELLQEQEQSFKLLSERVDRREKNLQDLKSQVFNLLGFFGVFQEVLLTAVTQLASSQAKCGKVWVPVFLSVLAGGATIVAVIFKFEQLDITELLLKQELHYQKVRGFSHSTYIQSFVVAVSS